MKKTYIAIFSVITIAGAIYLSEAKEKTKNVAEIKSESIDSKQNINSRQKAIKILQKREKRRAAFAHSNDAIQRVLTKEEQRIIELSSKGIGLSDINEQMLASYKQLAPKNSKLHLFIKSFSFKNEFEKELAKLDSESLKIIGELEDHPLSKELSDKTLETNIEVESYMKTGKLKSISDEKQHLIDSVTAETSAHESMDQLTRNIIESTVKYSIANSNSKLNQSEVELQAIEAADSYMQKESDKFRNIVNLSYSSLSTEKLREYSNFLQKINAKEATSLTTKALEPVFYRFSIGVMDRLKTQK